MTNIFVGNLSFEVTQHELTSAFAQYGNVERVNIITHRDSGTPRGFAFVEMTERDEANKAIAGLNGSTLNGRTLNVNEAAERPGSPPGRGARGNYDDRGRSSRS
jgi:RNA recognition motif-containing protein